MGKVYNVMLHLNAATLGGGGGAVYSQLKAYGT